MSTRRFFWKKRFPEKPARQADAGSPLWRRKKPRILLVEDDEDTQKLITRILESASYDVTIAGDGIDALTCFEQKDFDLILSDISMPNLDGFKLIEINTRRELRADYFLNRQYQRTG